MIDQKLKAMAIQNAIAKWERNKSGVYLWFEKNRHTPEECEKQIQYFKNMQNE